MQKIVGFGATLKLEPDTEITVVSSTEFVAWWLSFRESGEMGASENNLIAGLVIVRIPSKTNNADEVGFGALKFTLGAVFVSAVIQATVAKGGRNCARRRREGSIGTRVKLKNIT